MADRHPDCGDPDTLFILQHNAEMLRWAETQKRASHANWPLTTQPSAVTGWPFDNQRPVTAGWQCPTCGAGNAPSVRRCPCIPLPAQG